MSIDQISERLMTQYGLKRKQTLNLETIKKRYEMNLEKQLKKAICKGNVEGTGPNDFFSVEVMSRYINYILTSTNDEFIRKRHETYMKKHVNKVKSDLKSQAIKKVFHIE